MSVLEWFSRQKESAAEKTAERLDIPGDLWVKCPSCATIFYRKDLEDNHKVCINCGYHFRLTFAERLALTADADSFREFADELSAVDFLEFTDTKSYQARLTENKSKTGHNDTFVCGTATIHKYPVILGIMDFAFLGGSMGSVLGEKFVRAAEKALAEKLPLVVFTASGGARMQEGLTSLMQMAKTAAVIAKLNAAKLPYIVVFTDPTTGGTTASFAMLGDIHLAEKGALIGFAGPRVIEQTIRQKLPKGFQRAEHLAEHGFIDAVLERQDLKDYLAKVLKFFVQQEK
ncbi:acetyl-CoA carboxylase subunit beta [Candidatus Termititenax persephonae]|uniref:Acetyl-coenzyme A carboxylase carboxyl transferase subunit beta n=1 Tax=Candidatus Termititenax persephonae TaxID=2218525 RepID=A0A388TI27_9BACT|nr:acetyl-CoA carboxylase subunit beta [Candidatus Termititenax persephonae]